MATDYTIPKEEYRALVAENASLHDLMYSRAHDHAIQNMTEDELRITAANALEENRKLRELATGLYRCWQGEECEGCPMQDDGGWCVRDIQLRKLMGDVD